MNNSSVIYCTLIIRSQVEYRVAAQTVVLRCVLENSLSGQRRGFTDVDAMLEALRAELTDMQEEIVTRFHHNSKGKK